LNRPRLLICHNYYSLLQPHGGYKQDRFLLAAQRCDLHCRPPFRVSFSSINTVFLDVRHIFWKPMEYDLILANAENVAMHVRRILIEILHKINTNIRRF
jgi:hypothetical protein